MTKLDCTGRFDRVSGLSVRGLSNHMAELDSKLGKIVGSPAKRKGPKPKPGRREKRYCPLDELVPAVKGRALIAKEMHYRSPIQGKGRGYALCCAVDNSAGFKGRPSFSGQYLVYRLDGPVTEQALRRFYRKLRFFGVDVDKLTWCD